VNSNQAKIKHYGDIIPDSHARCVSFSPDDQLFAVGTTKEGILIYRTKDWKVIKELHFDSDVWSIAWSPNGDFLATGGLSKQTIIWKTSDWSILQILEDTQNITNLDWGSNGRYLVLGSLDKLSDNCILDIWDTYEWVRIKNKISCSNYPIFNHNGSMVAIDFELKGFEILSIPDLEKIAFLDFSDSSKHASLYKSSWSNDNKYFAGSSGDGRIRIWNVDNWNEVITKELHNYWKNGIYGVFFSPNSKYLLSGGFGQPILLETQNWDKIFDFPEGTIADIFDCSWRSDSKLFTLILRDGKRIEIWEILD